MGCALFTPTWRTAICISLIKQKTNTWSNLTLIPVAVFEKKTVLYDTEHSHNLSKGWAVLDLSSNKSYWKHWHLVLKINVSDLLKINIYQRQILYNL